MKIENLFFYAAVIAVIVFFGFYIRGGGQKAVPERKPAPAPVQRTDYSADIRQIEADFQQRRQKIEDYYQGVFGQLSEKRNQDMAAIAREEKARRNAIAEQANNTESTSYGYARPAGRAFSSGTALGSGRTSYNRVELNPQAAPELVAPRTFEARNDVAGDYNLDVEHYQRQKQCALDDLEKERQLALTAINNHQAYEAGGGIAIKACGTVTGILSGDGAPLAVIDGKILKEGQSLNGVKIVRILPGCVEFKGAKKSWSQKVNESPSPFWPQNEVRSKEN